MTFVPFMPAYHCTPIWTNFSILFSDKSCLFTRRHVSSFSLLHEALHEDICTLCSCCFALLFIPYYFLYKLLPTVPLIWRVRDTMDCWGFCVHLCLCVILQHDFKPLTAETVSCASRHLSRTLVYSVNIC